MREGAPAPSRRTYSRDVATDTAALGSGSAGSSFEELAAKEHVAAGTGPWKLAFRRLGRNKTAIAFGILFIVLVLTAVLAPVWAQNVAHTGPYQNHITDQIKVNGKAVDVVSVQGVPIGPQWMKADGKYFLGADGNGRDIMVRLLYGARTSLEIGLAAALITSLLAVIVGILAGFYRGWVDTVFSRTMDIIWAFPVVILGVALGTALNLGGLKVGPIEIQAGSVAIPMLIIGCVYVPYIARPLRGQVLSLREKEFVDA